MSSYFIIYLVGAGIFYIGSVAMYLECEWTVTLLKLIGALFFIGPMAALCWPLVLFWFAIETADDTVLWRKKDWRV